MKKILSILFLAVLLWTPSIALAQDSQSLAVAIHRMKTGSRGQLHWRECGGFLTSEEAVTRSQEYASYLLEEHARDSNFDPLVGAAIAMQESSLDRCAISRGAQHLFAQAMQATYHRDPTEEDIIHLLRNRRWRERMGVRTAFDAGLVQFRWPGSIAVLAGATDAGSLVDAHISIHMLALSMEHYRAACTTIDAYRGTRTFVRDGVVHAVSYSVSCADGYWVQHNSPSRFNYSYFQNVTRWLRALTRSTTETVPLPSAG